MLQDLWSRIHHWFVPSPHNEFHPHIIAEQGLLVLFGVILAAEGFLVSNVISTQSGTPSLAAVAQAPRSFNAAALPPGISTVAELWYRYVVQSLAQIAASAQTGRIAFLALLIIAAVLMTLLAYTLSMRRRRYKPVGYISGGTMLAFAIMLLYFNTNVFLPYMVSTQQLAAALSAVSVPHRISLTLKTVTLATTTSALQ